MKAINIVWDTDGKKVNLPTEVEIPKDVKFKDVDQELADWLSDQYGWCISSVDYVE